MQCSNVQTIYIHIVPVKSLETLLFYVFDGNLNVTEKTVIL